MNYENGRRSPETSPSTKDHFNYIKSIYAKRHAAIAGRITMGDRTSAYPWGGNMDERRLKLQNTVDGGFGEAHRKYHEKMSNAGFDPQVIVEIGTGTDATLVKNIITAYPNAQQFYVIELYPENVQGAKATLEREVEDQKIMEKVTFISGDASRELPKLQKKVDLIDMQFLLLHLPTLQPIDWDTEERGVYPTLQRVLGSVTDALEDDGVAIVGDLAMDDFDVNEGADFAANETTIELIKDAKKFIRGDGIFRGALNIGFNDRGAHAFKNLDQIIEKVEEYSDGRLRIDVDDNATQVVPIQNIRNHDDPRAAVAAYLAPTFAFQAERTVNRLKKKLEATDNLEDAEQIERLISTMEPGINDLWRLGERFVQALHWNEADSNRKKDDTIASLPSMVHVRFVKAA